MKAIKDFIKDFIYESAQPEFAKKVIALANQEKIKINDESSLISIVPPTKNYPYTQVSIRWNNGRNAWSGVRGAMVPSSQFDNEPLYIAITGWHDKYSGDSSKTSDVKRLSKELYESLFKDGLKEATNGKTAQWGTWKFAIRSEEDEEIALKHLETYMKALKKAKN